MLNAILTGIVAGAVFWVIYNATKDIGFVIGMKKEGKKHD